MTTAPVSIPHMAQEQKCCCKKAGFLQNTASSSCPHTAQGRADMGNERKLENRLLHKRKLKYGVLAEQPGLHEFNSHFTLNA